MGHEHGGKTTGKERRAETQRRGGGEYLREWILSGKSIRELASDMDMSGAARNIITKTLSYLLLLMVLGEMRRMHILMQALRLYLGINERRRREIMEALNGDRDIRGKC